MSDIATLASGLAQVRDRGPGCNGKVRVPWRGPINPILDDEGIADELWRAKSTGCFCGEMSHDLLVFRRRDPDVGEIDLNGKVKNVSRRFLLAELRESDVLCARCDHLVATGKIDLPTVYYLIDRLGWSR